MSKTKPIIGLAGGIGSGKSMVARHLATLGAAVFDADAAAQAALDQPDVMRQLTSWWGEAVLDDAGRVNRREVARRVFDDPVERKRLEGLIHPIVAQRRDAMIRQAVDDAAVKAIVLDVPLLYEVGLDAMCDSVIFVDADRAVRLQRVQAARGWDEAELARREKNQWPLDNKRRQAHDVIVNDGSETDCFVQVRAAFQRILESSAP